MNTGLTPFLAKMMATPRDLLAKADPAKLAVKYGIPETWARSYLDDWMHR